MQALGVLGERINSDCARRIAFLSVACKILSPYGKRICSSVQGPVPEKEPKPLPASRGLAGRWCVELGQLLFQTSLIFQTCLHSQGVIVPTKAKSIPKSHLHCIVPKVGYMGRVEDLLNPLLIEAAGGEDFFEIFPQCQIAGSERVIQVPKEFVRVPCSNPNFLAQFVSTLGE
ncbi:hypothetical protein BDV19DRAFT_352197 [Aspergillus venezuelensis]